MITRLKSKIVRDCSTYPCVLQLEKFVTVDIDKALAVAESKKASDYFEWNVFEDRLIQTIISFRPHKMVQNSQIIHPF